MNNPPGEEPKPMIWDIPSWMTRGQYRVLEGFADPEIITVLTPSIVAYNLGFSRTHASRSIDELQEHGLVEKVERGKYRATDRGRAFIDGELDADDLE